MSDYALLLFGCVFCFVCSIVAWVSIATTFPKGNNRQAFNEGSMITFVVMVFFFMGLLVCSKMVNPTPMDYYHHKDCYVKYVYNSDGEVIDSLIARSEKKVEDVVKNTPKSDTLMIDEVMIRRIIEMYEEEKSKN